MQILYYLYKQEYPLEDFLIHRIYVELFLVMLIIKINTE